MHPAEIAQLVVAAVLAGLGIWVLWLDPRRRLQRAFCLLMLGHAFVLTAHAFTGSSIVALRMFVYGLIALPFLLINFALTFVRAYGAAWRVPPWWSGARWSLLLGCIVLEAVYFVDHALVERTEFFGFLLAGPQVMTAAAALVIAIRARKEPGPANPLALFSLAFMLYPAFFGAFQVLNYTSGTMGLAIGLKASFAASGWVMSLVTCLLLADLARRRGDVRRQWTVMALFMAASASALGANLAFLLPSPPHWGAVLLTTFRSAWHLVFAGIVSYAIVAHCLFGLDRRFRFLIREGAFTATLAILFFALEQALEDRLTDALQASTGFGIVIGLAAAGLVALGVWPVHRLCRRFAEHLVPVAADRRRERAIEIYRAAELVARRDGIVTAREEQALSKLAKELRLSARDIEGDAWHLKMSAGDGQTAGAGESPA